MKTILSNKGQKILIDDEDYERVSKWLWRVNANGYAHHGVWVDGKLKQVKLHRFILGIKDRKIDVDHINMDRLDNRRSNLRTCDRSSNMANSQSRRNSVSKYKGVSLSQNGKWRARVMKNYKEVFHKVFETEKEAAKAYNEKATEIFGEFARLNEI